MKRISRRDILSSGTTGAAVAIAGAGELLANSAQASAAQDASVSVLRAHRESAAMLRQLGLRPIVNAAGTITTLGGSLMAPEVLAAWQAGARHFVDLIKLQDRVGEEIARLIGVDAALVTTGAAGGILIGSAAAATLRDPSLVKKLPFAMQDGFHVIKQRAQIECYDHQIRACGLSIVEVDTLAEAERAFGPKTVMTMAYNVLESAGQIRHAEWLQLSHRHNVPAMVDAAADTPPVAALSAFNRMGYDMVVFSGGKAMRGPQDAGLLLGRKDLIEAAKLNTSPRCPTIGRGLKVAKEDMFAMLAAVKRWLTLDHGAQWREYERRIGVIEKKLSGLPSMRTERIVPAIANHVPHLLVHWDETRLTRDQLKKELLDGEPSIATARISGTGEAGFLISVFMLEKNEEKVVAARLHAILSRALAS